MTGLGRKDQVLLLVLVSLYCCCQAAEPILGAEEGQTRQAHVYVEGLVPGTPFLSGVVAPLAAGAAAVGQRRSLEMAASPCGDGLTAPGSPGCETLYASGTPPPQIEVPDWSHEMYDSPHGSAGKKAEGSGSPQAVQVDFGGPLPARGSWAAAKFSGYGANRPIGPFLLSCTLETGHASCDVVDTATQEVPGSTLYNGWSMWGDGPEGDAYVSLSPVGVLGAPGFSGDDSQNLNVVCCELSNNAQGCIACTGYPSLSYDPLNSDSQQAKNEGSQQTAQRPTGPPKRPPKSPRVSPVKRKELFDLLPNLRTLLGGAKNPRRLPCDVSDEPPSHRPTLGDILRSRKDLSMFGAMIENSHIQQLIPCRLSFFAVTDDRARDFQGQRPPPCLHAALARPENQRDLIRLVGRSTLLGNYKSVPTDISVPVLYGNAGRMTKRGRREYWNNVELTGGKVVYNRGVIHFLTRNDMQDAESVELLRRIVYWSCLHEHLQRFPGLTRLALLLVDSRRPLPVLGVPPGLRPEWVGRENPGWTAPPPVADEVEEPEGEEEEEDETEEDSTSDPEARKPKDETEKEETETETGKEETEKEETEKEDTKKEAEKEKEERKGGDS